MKLVIAGISIVVIGLVGFLVFGGKDDDPKVNTPSQSQESQDTATTAVDKKVSETVATITYSDSGFSPTSTSIKIGQSLQIINNSSTSLDFESDPHPVHTDNSELNAGSISAGASKVITISEAGTWGFHNHANSAHQATVEVK